MKKIITTLIIALLSINVYSTVPSNPKIKFIKGNIQDKIESVKEDAKDNNYSIAQTALDFVLDNIELLRNDRDFAGLAVAAIYAYPEKEFSKKNSDILNKFGSVFYSFNDPNVRSSVLDKLLLVCQNYHNEEIVDFVNNYVKSAAIDKHELSDVEKKAIQSLSKIGNQQSFSILYDVYINEVWMPIQTEIKNSLVSLASKSSDLLLSVIKKADFAEMKQIYSIFIENSELSLTIKSEIAENLLSNSMIIIRDSSKITKELTAFQFENCKIICQNNWTRGYALVLSYFDVAKTEFNAGFLSTDEFATVISFLEKTATKDAVKILTSYLEELNKETEKNNLPANSIVLAVIQALGNLGDKYAFDCLLFTTYLNYPEEIVAQARSALSSLKW